MKKLQICGQNLNSEIKGLIVKVLEKSKFQLKPLSQYRSGAPTCQCFVFTKRKRKRKITKVLGKHTFYLI